MAVSCDPNDLMAQAKCLECNIPDGMELSVLIYLFCQIANNPSGGGGTPALPNGQIFVGNAANAATAVPMSGDATISNTGAVTLANNATARGHLGSPSSADEFLVLGANPAELPNSRSLSVTGGNLTIADLGPGNFANLNTTQDIQTTSTPQFAHLGLGVAADATAVLKMLMTAIGNTVTDGTILQNLTAATAGQQQYSPAFHWTGNGWDSTAAASKPVDFRAYVQTFSAPGGPGALLTFDYSINGAAYTAILTLSVAGGGLVSAQNFSGGGAQLTSLSASALASGTVATARLGSGSANAASFLRGDQTWVSTAQIIGTVALTAQTATIATTTIVAAPATGLYEVSGVVLVTTAGSAGTVTVTIGWTDEVGATTSTAVIMNLNASDRTEIDPISISVTNASNITYATTVAGATGSPQYALKMAVKRII